MTMQSPHLLIEKSAVFLRKNLKQIAVFTIMTIISAAMISYKIKERGATLSDDQIKIIAAIFLSLTLLMLGVLFLAKHRNWKIEHIYLIFTLVLGIGYVASLVVGAPQDEVMRFLRVYEIAEGELYPDESGHLRHPENLDIVISPDYQTGDGYTKMAEKLSHHASLDYKNSNGTTDGDSLFSYLPHILGVWLGKILNLPIIPLVYLCRLLGLITCVTIMFFCIKFAPFMKKIIFLVGMLPVTLQMFAGVTADAMTICAGIALVTYVLYTRYKMTRKLNWRDYILLSLICLILCATKVVYAPMCLILFWLPEQRFQSRKSKYWLLFIIGVLVLSASVARVFLSAEPHYRFSNPEERLNYIFRQPLGYLGLMLQTIGTSLPELAQSMAGRWLGTLLVDLYTPYSSLAILLFILLCTEREHQIPGGLRWAAIASFVAGVVGSYGSMFVIWSDLNLKTIEGVHGRYFLPMSLLLPMMFLPSNREQPKTLVKSWFLYIFCALMNVYAVTAIVCTYI